MKKVTLVLALTFVAGLTGCSRYFVLPVWENGRQVNVSKWFNDGALDYRVTAYDMANHSNDEAIKIMKIHMDRYGADAWDHYDVAILYERKAEWDNAEQEINLAISAAQASGNHRVDTIISSELSDIQSYRAQQRAAGH